MKYSDMKAAAEIAIMVHSSYPIVYVGSAVSEDIKPDEKRLVVMVNDRGDRLAIKKPSEPWLVEKTKFPVSFLIYPNQNTPSQ